MKRIVSIATPLITAYFLALPFLFACHLWDHEPFCHHHQVSQPLLTESIPDCALCDLYADHKLIVETDLLYFPVPAYFELVVSNLEDFVIKVGTKHYLRGPPLS